MKSIIIGNGIDIQYGGYSKRGNQAILTRAIHNIECGKYAELGWNKDDVKDVFDVCVAVINKVIMNDVYIPTEEDYLFLQMEMERVKRCYKNTIATNEIGMEDIFLGAEILYLNAHSHEEREMVRTAIHKYLQPVLLDAIYDDGKVNEVYKNFPDSLVQYLKSYDAIFTLNYDTNIEQAIGAEVPVYHLHGCFSDFSKRADIVDDKYKHMYCNGIMTWYWLEKYEEEGADERYGLNVFNKIEGNIDILGISPCNDEQLYIRMWQNRELRTCNYFYYDRKEAVEIRKHIKGTLEGHVTDRDVRKFWARFK